MQDYISKEFLTSLGVKPEELDAIHKQLNDDAEIRIGDEIIESLTEADIQILLDMQDTASDDEIGKWIAEHVPDYPEIVQDNIDIVVGEFIETLPEESAASSQ